MIHGENDRTLVGLCLTDAAGLIAVRGMGGAPGYTALVESICATTHGLDIKMEAMDHVLRPRNGWSDVRDPDHAIAWLLASAAELASGRTP